MFSIPEIYPGSIRRRFGLVAFHTIVDALTDPCQAGTDFQSVGDVILVGDEDPHHGWFVNVSGLSIRIGMSQVCPGKIFHPLGDRGVDIIQTLGLPAGLSRL
ncbi:MAG: hypothetical protein KatS3mg104_0694 [Phycisphaerae bacterium]|nr:MAG: hypothetical protein KatS3mg104_0694 [Phycisphaerae bacterium]